MKKKEVTLTRDPNAREVSEIALVHRIKRMNVLSGEHPLIRVQARNKLRRPLVVGSAFSAQNRSFARPYTDFSPHPHASPAETSTVVLRKRRRNSVIQA